MVVIQRIGGSTPAPTSTSGGGIPRLTPENLKAFENVPKPTTQSTPKTTVVPQATQSQPQTFLQGAGKFLARTGVALADVATEAVDFTTSFLSNNLDILDPFGRIEDQITQKLTGKEAPHALRKRQTAESWKKFYNEKLKEDKVPTRELKEAVDQLQKIEYIQPSKEWSEAPLKVKLTTKLPETVLTIGPSIIASLGIYAINPALGVITTVGSTANDVKETGIAEGFDADTSEKIGLVAGLLVGALDRIVPDELFSGANKGRFLSNFVKRTVATSLKEGGTEIAQEDIQIIAETVLGKDLNLNEALTRNVMAGLGGLLGGAGAEMVVSTINNTINQDILSEPEVEPEPQEEGAQVVTPDQAIAIALDEDVKPEQSQAIVKVAAQAKQTDQDIQIDVDEKGNVIAELVERTQEDGGKPAEVKTEEAVKPEKKAEEIKPKVVEQAKEVEVPREQLPVGEGKKKLSRLEARITESLDKAPEEVKNLSTFNQMNKADQKAKAAKYVTENQDEAMAVIRGEKQAPKGLLTNSVFVALYNKAAGDPVLARALSTLRSTRFGQEISILTEIDPDNPVKLMREVVKIREEAFTKRFKNQTVAQATKKVKSDIQAKIKAPTKSEWSNFLDSIEC